MGKAYRVKMSNTREQSDGENIFAGKKKKRSGGAPAWVSTLAVALIAAVLVGCVLASVITEGGYALRLTKVMKSEHYTVNGTMLSYMFYQNYNVFLNQYGSIIKYMNIDVNKSLKKQASPDKETTWFEYFMKPTLDGLKHTLIYCEEAEKRGIKLDEKDKSEIDGAIEALGKAAEKNNLTLNRYLTAAFGAGVTVNDVRKCLNMSQLASKCSKMLGDEMKKDVSDDEIKTYFDDNPGKFLTAEVVSKTFTVKKEEAGEDYEQKKFKARVDAEEFAKCANTDDFKRLLLESESAEIYDDAYESNVEGIEPSKLPNKTELDRRRKEICDRAIENVLLGKKAKAAETEGFEDKLFAGIEEEVTSDLENALENAVNAKYPWTEDKEDEAGYWISDKSRKKYDVKTFEEEEKDEGETEYTVSVYMIENPMHRDETPSCDVGHILIKPEQGEKEDHPDHAADEKAKAEAERLLAEFEKGGKSKEALEKLAENVTDDSSVFYYDVRPGQMTAAYDDWIFDGARKEGDAGIVKTEYGYHVIYYIKNNPDMPAWKALALEDLVGEKTTKWLEDGVAAFKVDVNEKNAGKVRA